MALYWEMRASVGKWQKFLSGNESVCKMYRSIIILEMNITLYRLITSKWNSYKRLWYIFNLGFVYYYLSTSWSAVMFIPGKIIPENEYFIYNYI